MKAKRLLCDEKGELITVMGAPIVINTARPHWETLAKMLAEEHKVSKEAPTVEELNRQWARPAYQP